MTPCVNVIRLSRLYTYTPVYIYTNNLLSFEFLMSTSRIKVIEINDKPLGEIPTNHGLTLKIPENMNKISRKTPIKYHRIKMGKAPIANREKH